MSDRIRVVVIDDQAIVREGLVTVLSLLPDIDVVGQAPDGAQGVELVERESPDVALLDLRMPVMDGLEATRRIVASRPGTGILILTTFADEDSIIGALRAGAKGYLTKDADREEVAAAVRAVAQGHTTLSGEVGASLIARTITPLPELVEGPTLGVPPSTGSGTGIGPSTGSGTGIGDLTQREQEVLNLIADGLSNHEIAARLYVGVSTVKTHINAIFAKLGVRDRAQAIALYHRSERPN